MAGADYPGSPILSRAMPSLFRRILPPRARGFEWMPPEVGYGWLIDRHLGHRRLYHVGASPGFSAMLAYYPDDELTVVVLSSIYSNAAQPTGEAVAAMALGQAPGPTLSRDQPLPAAEIARLVGDYRLEDRINPSGAKLSVYQEDGSLWVSPNPARRPGRSCRAAPYRSWCATTGTL